MAAADEDNFYTVERILKRQKKGKKLFYLVKWEGYPDTQATWEPIKNLRNVRKMVRDFENELQMQNTHKLPTSKSTALEDSSVNIMSNMHNGQQSTNISSL